MKRPLGAASRPYFVPVSVLRPKWSVSSSEFPLVLHGFGAPAARRCAPCRWILLTLARLSAVGCKDAAEATLALEDAKAFAARLLRTTPNCLCAAAAYFSTVCLNKQYRGLL
jgi:hypothetical protein